MENNRDADVESDALEPQNNNYRHRRKRGRYLNHYQGKTKMSRSTYHSRKNRYEVHNQYLKDLHLSSSTESEEEVGFIFQLHFIYFFLLSFCTKVNNL